VRGGDPGAGPSDNGLSSPSAININKKRNTNSCRQGTPSDIDTETRRKQGLRVCNIQHGFNLPLRPAGIRPSGEEVITCRQRARKIPRLIVAYVKTDKGGKDAFFSGPTQGSRCAPGSQNHTASCKKLAHREKRYEWQQREKPKRNQGCHVQPGKTLQHGFRNGEGIASYPPRWLRCQTTPR